jgi:hypothetical protein
VQPVLQQHGLPVLYRLQPAVQVNHCHLELTTQVKYRSSVLLGVLQGLVGQYRDGVSCNLWDRMARKLALTKPRS